MLHGAEDGCDGLDHQRDGIDLMQPWSQPLLWKGAVVISSPPSLDVASVSKQEFPGNVSPSVITFTTAQSNELIFISFTVNSTTGTVTSISDNSGVTSAWAQAASQLVAGLGSLEIWYTKASAPMSAASISVVHPTTVTFFAVTAFGVTGANTSAPFDGAAVTGPSDPLSITTTVANDLVIAAYRSNTTSGPTAGTGMTQIGITGSYNVTEYRVASTAGTYSCPIAAGAGGSNAGIVLAVKH